MIVYSTEFIKIIGKIAGKIIEDTGKINQDTGKIELSEDFSGVSSGKMPEATEDSKITKYRGQRGPDKKKRNFPPQTLKNLPQFRDKPHEEVRQYILETRGIDIGSNVNWNKTMMWVLIGLAIVVGGIGVWKLWQQSQERKNHEDIIETNTINY